MTDIVALGPRLLAARGHELRAVLQTHPVNVDADLVRLAQIASNLLDNAAKFTPPHGRITLAATVGAADDPEPQWLVVSVEDDGAGISACPYTGSDKSTPFHPMRRDR